MGEGRARNWGSRGRRFKSCQPDSVISQDIGNFRTLRGGGVLLILAFHVRCGVNRCRQAARAKLAKKLWVHMWVRSPA